MSKQGKARLGRLKGDETQVNAISEEENYGKCSVWLIVTVSKASVSIIHVVPKAPPMNKKWLSLT